MAGPLGALDSRVCGRPTRNRKKRLCLFPRKFVEPANYAKDNDTLQGRRWPHRYAHVDNQWHFGNRLLEAARPPAPRDPAVNILDCPPTKRAAILHGREARAIQIHL